jgi:hypothetical protein
MYTLEQLMQFIRLPKLIDIAVRVFTEYIVDRADTYSVQRISIRVIQMLGINWLVS